MDKLDRIALSAMMVAALWALALVVTQVRTDHGQRAGQSREAQAVPRIDPALEQKVETAKNLLASGSLAQAQGLIDELIAASPYEALPHVLKGDVFLYRQEPVAAMFAYRTAVDLNPDFLDKKSPLFQGKKIKKTVEEARAAMEAGLAVRPDDAALLEARKVYYYMLRKIAGSCG